jgi:hypothetical protein
MPIGTKVHNCVDKLRQKMPYGVAIAICQKSTNQNYMTGEMLGPETKKSKSKSKSKSHPKHMFRRTKKYQTKKKNRK